MFAEAGIPRNVLHSAEDQASFALATGGITVKWIDCSQEYACEAPLLPNEVVIMVKLFRPLTTQGHLKGETLGNAVGPRNGTGVYAWIWYNEIRRAATVAGFVSWHDLLGYVIAHEIGHLLLGPDHCAGTVMQANWRPRELTQIWRRQLRFNDVQRAGMQRCALVRSRSSRFGSASAAVPLSSRSVEYRGR